MAVAGVRPIYHFYKFFSLALEPGVDHVDVSGIHQSSTLYKLTLAPQVSLGNQFSSPPVIRAYVTYVTWTESLKATSAATILRMKPAAEPGAYRWKRGGKGAPASRRRNGLLPLDFLEQ